MTACYSNAASLLEDARLLAKFERLSRSAALTVLSMEELAKVTDIHDTFVRTIIHPPQDSWGAFWERFIRHKPKQRSISKYGESLAANVSLDNLFFSNPSPYTHYLTDSSPGYLDALKQRSLYVDFMDDAFQCPGSSHGIDQILDWLFAFVEERIDSFASWHVSENRSLALLEHKIEFLRALSQTRTKEEGDKVVEDFGGKAFRPTQATHSEIRADVRYRLVKYSSSFVPDYLTFRGSCTNVLARVDIDTVASVVVEEAAQLRSRLEIEALKFSAVRSYKMLKLLHSYVESELPATAHVDVFGAPDTK
jgi:AbiV family abortive infection protein